MSSVIERLRERAAEQPRRIIFPESDDPRVIEAANRLAEAGIATPVLLDPPQTVRIHPAIETMSLQDDALREDAAMQLYRNRQHKGLSPEGAREAVAADRLIFAAALVKLGKVEAGIAGSLATTANVLRAGLYGIGMPPSGRLVSSFFLIQFADGNTVSFADCAVVPDPDADQLAEIAVTTARSHRRLTGTEPRVALLSFSTLGSAEHPRVDKVRRAKQRALEIEPQLLIDGELQFDAAYSAQVAQRKAKDSPVAGHANVFIFPDLDSGNIGYKIAERVGKASAFGPIIQGLQSPWMDLSRGCSVDDIVNVAAITACLCAS